jgi:hypothetical protein
MHSTYYTQGSKGAIIANSLRILSTFAVLYGEFLPLRGIQPPIDVISGPNTAPSL